MKNPVFAPKFNLYLHQQGIATPTSAGKAIFQICGVFAEFEQSIIRERINAGLSRAKSNGKKLSRPRVDQSVEQAIQYVRERGDEGIRKIARQMGVRVSVVRRVAAGQN